MTKYTPWSRLLSTDRGNESIQTVTILAVAATVLIGLLNVGRTVRDRGREKVEAVLAGADNSGPSASARPPEYDTATAAEIPGAEVAPTVAFGSRNSVTDAGDSRRSASAFDTAAPTGGTPATSPLVKPTPGNNPGTTNPKPSGPQIDPPPVKSRANQPPEASNRGKAKSILLIQVKQILARRIHSMKIHERISSRIKSRNDHRLLRQTMDSKILQGE